MTSVAYGFAMPVSRGVLTPPGFPAWLPLIGGGNPPSSYADFAGGRYWCGHSQWLTSEDASAYFSAAGYSFTRATVASRMRSDGKLEAVASGVLRFDHDSGSLAATGLRIEGQRTNLVQQTEAFDNAYWSKQSVSVTANGATAPDGNMTADAHMEDASNSKHSLYRAGSPLAATGICTWSVFVAPALRNWTQIYIFDNPVVTERWANFDVANGVVGYSQNISGSRLQKFQNGWYRPSIGGLLTSGSGNVQILSASANVNGAGPGFQGLSAASLYIWGGSSSWRRSHRPTCRRRRRRRRAMPTCLSAAIWACPRSPNSSPAARRLASAASRCAGAATTARRRTAFASSTKATAIYM